MNKATLILVLTLVAALTFSGAVSAQNFSNKVITGQHIKIEKSIENKQIINSGKSYNVRINRNFVISRNVNVQGQFGYFRSYWY
jgi:outer membrane lipoprotein SlyB